MNTIFSGDLTALQILPDFSKIVSTATVRLLQLFGDAETVCNAFCNDDPEAMNSLTLLSQPSLLVLLTSPDLTACSENTVLMLVSYWMEDRKGMRGISSAKTVRQVVVCLRLGQLSNTFLYDILPQLPWLGITRAERESLLRFAAAGPAAGRDAEQEPIDQSPTQKHLVIQHRLFGPEAWYAPQLRPLPVRSMGPVLTFTWTLSRREIVEALQPRPTGSWCRSPLRFFNGFTIHATVMPVPQGEKPLHMGGLLLSIAVPCGSRRLKFAAAEVESVCILLKPGYDFTFVASSVVHDDMVVLCTTMLRPEVLGGPLDVGGWQDFLQDDRVLFQVNIPSCQ